MTNFGSHGMSYVSFLTISNLLSKIIHVFFFKIIDWFHNTLIKISVSRLAVTR